MFGELWKELREHAPFTVVGAITGIIVLIVSRGMRSGLSYNIFYILHPMHVLLSAVATASMYKLHRSGRFRGKGDLWTLLIVGYVGSVGIATISDSLIPYLGESLLRMPNRKIHLGFIEEWWLVNPLAILGVAIAHFRPATKFPHGGHVLLSTWASLFHIMMAAGQTLNLLSYAAVFCFLFLAVWIPCCLSDIVLPLLFVKNARGHIDR